MGRRLPDAGRCAPQRPSSNALTVCHPGSPPHPFLSSPVLLTRAPPTPPSHPPPRHSSHPSFSSSSSAKGGFEENPLLLKVSWAPGAKLDSGRKNSPSKDKVDSARKYRNPTNWTQLGQLQKRD
eukprot:7444338-Pyramimonas_sp.AAC.1